VAEIVLEEVRKEFGGGVVAVDDVSLEIADGEFMVLVGPSGCGKSTLLRLIAGLEEATGGTIRIGERDVTDLAPRSRDIAMVFQSYALYPHMTVRQNLGYGLKVRRTGKAQLAERVERVARMLRLEELLDRRPAALSGGQRQRVAMGRAIVREPQAFLMDEPLSNLDAKLRVQMRAEIHQLQRRLGVTTLYVTHDQVEAMTMGDRVAVMRDGHLQQVDTPQALYESPVNEFVAGFIGSPAINLVEAQLERDGDSLWATFGHQRLQVDDQLARNKSGLGSYLGRTVILGIRPEDFEDAALEPDTPPERRITTTCDLTEPLGSEVLVHFTVDAPGVTTSAHEHPEDADVHLAAGGNGAAGPHSRLVARVSPRTRIAEGTEIQLAVDTRRLYFFDPETREVV
jgi:multiple sugar transport system ATP-binding protein